MNVRSAVPRHPELLGIRVVITARTIGEPDGIDRLKQVILKHNVGDWLNFLSRAQSLLIEEHAVDHSRQTEFVESFFSRRLLTKIFDWANSQSEPEIFIFGVPDVIGVLQEYAILHAPESEGRGFENDGDFEDFGIAVLLAAGFLYDGVENPTNDDVTFGLTKQRGRLFDEPSWKLIARSIRQFEFGEQQISEKVRTFRERFLEATGVDSQNYFLGGLMVWAREQSKLPESLREAWFGVFADEASEKENALIQDFLSIRAIDLAGLRNYINAVERSEDLSTWSLVPILKYPIVKLSERGYFVLHPGAVARSLFEGLYFALIDQCQEIADPRSRQSSINDVTRDYGDIVEDYIQRELAEIFGFRSFKLPESDCPRADFLVLESNGVVLLESKTSRFTPARFYKCANVEELRSLVGEKVGIKEAVSQLRQTIVDLRNFDVEDSRLSAIDWTTLAVCPVVISEENLPSVPFGWESIYAAEDQPLQELSGGSGKIGHLRIISPDDLFYLTDILATTSLSRVLLLWGNDVKRRNLSFRSFLVDHGIKLKARSGKTHFLKGVNLVCRALGLNEVKEPEVD